MVKPAKVEVLETDALYITEAELNGALKNEEDAKADKKMKDNKENAENITDYQLTRALDLVKALGLYERGQAPLDDSKKEEKK